MAAIGHYLEYLAARAGMGLAQSLSAGRADSFGTWLGWTAGRLLKSRRRLAFDNIRRGLGDAVSEAQIESIVDDVFRNTGRTLVELARFRKLGAEGVKDLIVPAGLKAMQEARDRGRGAIVATAHFGNWELMGVYPAVYGIPSDTLAIRQHNLKINEMIINLRQSLGVRILEVPANARQVFRSLKENRVVIIAADQHASAGTLVMDFFGRPAAVARGPALFAIRRGCPVIPMLIRRERYDRHVVIAGEAVYSPDSGDEEANVRAMTAAYLKFLEDNIRLYPDQWLWTHNRWKPQSAAGNHGGE